MSSMEKKSHDARYLGKQEDGFVYHTSPHKTFTRSLHQHHLHTFQEVSSELCFHTNPEMSPDFSHLSLHSQADQEEEPVGLFIPCSVISLCTSTDC